MKKLISLTLAIMLVLSLSVPALADTTLGESATTGDTKVTTTIGQGYVFTIPGETGITALSTEAQEIGAVTMTKCNLTPGKVVTVTVAQGTPLTFESNTIEFTTAISNNSFDAVNETGDVTLTVAAENWVNKPAGTYAGTIAFTFGVN